MKIFSVFFVLMTFVAGANAVVDPRKYCVYEGFGMSVLKDGSFVNGLEVDYVIYFNNNDTNIPKTGDNGTPLDEANCTDKVNALIDKIAKDKDDIETVLLFGSADTAGNADTNAKLAFGRVQTVQNLLSQKNIPTCAKGNDNKLTGVCAVATMGDAFQRAIDNTGSGQYARAVFMYVLYKRDICGKTGENIKLLKGIFTEYSNKINGSESIKTELDDVAKICNKDENIITLSQRKAILDAENKALKALNDAGLAKEIAKGNPDLAVKLIAQSIKSIRLSLADNASVWKNENGNFNGWRVVSDSIAGIVLGTAGGVITSNVVKKNQLKKGFENIMCTIGGQKVADYGDEFVVGIQR